MQPINRIAIVSVLSLALNASGAAQGKKPDKFDFGPVVTAYLTGLRAEQSALDFQLRHGELGRSDYERARQRLLLVQRYVESAAAQSNEDAVPQLQVLADDEFSVLGVSDVFGPDNLKLGAALGGRWKLIGIERGRSRFFVFELLPRNAPPVAEALLTVDPRDVIETVVVPDRPAFAPQPVTQSAVQQRFAGPRIRHFFLPEYTQTARANGVTGELFVNALFGRDGRVGAASVEQTLGYGLDERALEAVKLTSFEPARLAEQPVDARVRLGYSFNLRRIAVRVLSTTADAGEVGARQ